jgi:hypothetical protein
MSAFAVKVSSDKQTLILAGEPMPPRRGSAGDFGAGDSDMGVQLQRVTVLVVQEDYAAAPPDSSSSNTLVAPAGRALLPSAAAIRAPAVRARALVPYISPNRVLSAGAAEYARTQNLSDDGRRSQIIDTYA